MQKVVFRLAVLASMALVTAPPAASQHPEEAKPGWVGIVLGPSVERTLPLGSEIVKGVRVDGVVKRSPADRAGIRARDLVLRLDGHPTPTAAELASAVRTRSPGTWVTLSVMRGSRLREFQVRLGDRLEDIERADVRRGWLGLEVVDLPEALLDHFGAPEGTGVMVSRIEPGGPAESAGLVLGDVIYAVDDEPVQGAATFLRRIERGGVGNRVELSVARNGARITLEAIIEEGPEEEPDRVQVIRVRKYITPKPDDDLVTLP